MPHQRTVCPVPGCPQLTDGGRCPTHRNQDDPARGTATQRGYTSRAHRAFRHAVPQRDPICVICHTAPSTHADHWPTPRRDLIAQGLNPNNPKYGRGLCASCNSIQTTQRQPGGWNAR